MLTTSLPRHPVTQSTPWGGSIKWLHSTLSMISKTARMENDCHLQNDDHNELLSDSTCNTLVSRLWRLQLSMALMNSNSSFLLVAMKESGRTVFYQLKRTIPWARTTSMTLATLLLSTTTSIPSQSSIHSRLLGFPTTSPQISMLIFNKNYLLPSTLHHPSIQ